MRALPPSVVPIGSADSALIMIPKKPAIAKGCIGILAEGSRPPSTSPRKRLTIPPASEELIEDICICIRGESCV